jgi:HD-like signal output (HDOD) protein
MTAEATPTILFVDDEPGILKALRRLCMDEDWNLLFAASGAEGLEILAEEEVDLIVSDVRMPEMDGVEFLAQAMRLYPATVRIFLSGYSDRGPVAEALAQGSAQQILAKPWDENELKEVIFAALRQSRQQKQKSATLQTLINGLPHLPALPESYHTVSKALTEQGEFSIELIEQLAQNDATLTTTLLHWANSALFGQRGKVDSVQRAILLLGTDIVESLFLSKAIDAAIGTKARLVSEFDNQEFQQHSVACALIARWLANFHFPNDAKLADRAFTAALLHDIGVFVAAGLFPAEFVQALKLASQERLLLAEAEQQLLQMGHPELGAILAEWWTLPDFIVNAIRWHLEPQLATADVEIVELVYLANLLCSQFDINCSGNCRVPDVDQAIWNRYALTPEVVAQLQVLISEQI